MSKTALVLAAHGSRVEPATNAHLQDLARQIAARGLFDEVSPAFHHGQPSFSAVLDRLQAEDIVVVPVMTSEGYFCDVVLPHELRQNKRFSQVRLRQTLPIGTHPRMFELVRQRVGEIVDQYGLAAARPAVGVVGHGTVRHPRSRVATIRLAEFLKGMNAFLDVAFAFLDESPPVESLLRPTTWGPSGIPPTLIVIPFLISGGPHATVDIPERLGLDLAPDETPPLDKTVEGRRVLCDRAIGSDPRVIDIILDLAREAKGSGIEQAEQPSQQTASHPLSLAGRGAGERVEPSSSRHIGVVYLVGAGPGDPGLITVRGREVLRQADVVVHDRLISPELLTEVRPDAELVDVGKMPGRHRVSQAQINEILVDRARRGLRVVRLKGGDPFMFGRGFEELTACREAGVICAIVPGVSSALAAPASAGIPVTTRGTARNVMIVTAEGSPESTDLDYFLLAGADTLVILMGRAKLAEVTRSLMQAGKSSSTPAACIERATTPHQRVVVATLESLADEVERCGLVAPIITVIGDVAGYSDPAVTRTIGPLAGKRVAITRPRSSARQLEQRLLAAGALPIACPMIRITYPKVSEALDHAICEAQNCDWIVFTSAHAVIGFWRRMKALALDARALSVCRIAAAGAATAARLARYGIHADLVPACHASDTLAQELSARDARRPLRVLFPRGDHALPTIPRSLRAAGITVEEVQTYSTVDATPSAAAVSLLREGVDVILFFSPTAVRRFAALTLPVGDALIGCVGPTTAQAVKDVGLHPDVIADVHTADGLVAALQRHFQTPATSPTT